MNQILKCALGMLLFMAAAAHAQIDLRFNQVADTPNSVLDIAHANDGTNRVFMLQRIGRIRIARNDQTDDGIFLDFMDRVGTAGERGALSLTFPPGYGPKTYFYVYYINTQGNSVLSRFHISADPDVAMADSEEILFQQFQPFSNHNGGRIRFGPDGYLYLSLGDGGGSNDPEDNAQDPSTLLGKLLRIDVESGSATYDIPPDNPFVNDGSTLNEIWALGLRNPYRIAFDRENGNLFIADVGQGLREEINVQPASSGGGENYGWDIAEGDICNGNCSSFTDPVWVYDHNSGDCSITGGEVYRGSRYPGLQGIYLYGDFCSGRVWGLQASGGGWSNQLLSDGELSNIFTFGQDEQGNVYVSTSGGVFRLSNGADRGSGFPLSGRVSGQWVAEGMNRQGLNLTSGVRPDNSRYVFAVWYTYLEGEPFWIVGNADYTPPSDVITIPIQRFSGLGFLQDDGAESDGPFSVGSLTLRPLSCDELEVSWDFPDFSSSGTGIMQRLANVAGVECE